MPYANALSVHADPAAAIGEAVGEILERLGPAPDLAMLFVSGAHADHLGNIVGVVDETLGPRALAGTTAVSVIGGAQEVEEVAAVSLWAGAFDGSARTMSLDASSGGLDPGQLDPGNAHTVLLLADPFSFPVDAAIDHWSAAHPGLTVIGGLASLGQGPGGNVLVAGRGVARAGAVAVFVEGEVTVETVVSQGCRPIGSPLAITRSEGHVIHELGGVPPLRQLEDTFGSLSERDKMLVNQGLHIGRVVDEHKLDFERGDFIIRAVMGADQASGAMAIGEPAALGATVQFQVRDDRTAHEDLTELLASAVGPADGALVFTCNGRGTHLFPEPHHDAATVSDMMGTTAVGGMFCAGEIGPVGGRAFVTGFTASVALFR